MHSEPASLVRTGPAHFRSFAFCMVASHSAMVGSRQSPAADPSFNPQSPVFRPAADFLAASQSDAGKQSTCFNQISPVAVSVTVPFPQSIYRLLVTAHGPATAGDGIGAGGAGDADVIDVSVERAGAIT